MCITQVPVKTYKQQGHMCYFHQSCAIPSLIHCDHYAPTFHHQNPVVSPSGLGDSRDCRVLRLRVGTSPLSLATGNIQKISISTTQIPAASKQSPCVCTTPCGKAGRALSLCVTAANCGEHVDASEAELHAVCEVSISPSHIMLDVIAQQTVEKEIERWVCACLPQCCR
jgi:hypothetical protein